MRTLFAFTISLALISTYGLYPAEVAAESNDSGGSDLQGFAPDASATSTVPPDGQDHRFLVTNMRSTTAGAVKEGTVVKVQNLGKAACQVSVQWLRLSLTTPDCTTTRSINPGTSETFCSRLVSSDDFALCRTTCSPELTFNDGMAIVNSTKGGGCKKLGVDAQIFYVDSSSGAPLAVHAPKVVKLKGNRGE